MGIQDDAVATCAAYRVTENGQTWYFTTSPGEELMDAAQTLRRYCTSTEHSTGKFISLYSQAQPITPEEYQRMILLRMENTGKVAGVFDLDFDKREFSAVHIMNGWTTWATLNGSLTDIALIDAVISDDLCVGSKAIWDASKLQHIFVTRCHPASIGFSTAAGCLQIVRDTDDYGLTVELRSDGEKIIAPIAAGVLSELEIWQAKRMPLDCPETLLLQEECMVALDGERELRGHAGDTLTFTITRHGPWRVQAKRALEEAVRHEFFAAGRMIDPT